MIVFRIGRTKWANDLTGEGSKLLGGKWNRIGVPCIYASESRALALLEYTVNIGVDDIPRALSITTIQIPDEQIAQFPFSALPGNWKEYPSPGSTQDFGSTEINKTSAVRLPSAIIAEENNYLINTLHPLIRKIKIIDVANFAYDVRIKLN
ncbi:MAG: RES family NAD+ phosphorylase [Flavisolibacter sp.]